MTSEKQILANQHNAQLSTGPVTVSGKAIVASNAVKHGIFTKDLIVSSGVGQENQVEYEELLSNLLCCLTPSNQMETLLVEKIAVDFWRLRRTIKFEAGSIAKEIEAMLKSYYSYGQKDNKGIDEEIRYTTEKIDWNTAYLECLKKNEVQFDQPIWVGKEIESDIQEDLYQIARSLPDLTSEERDKLYKENVDLTALLKKHGYSKPKDLSARLIEIYSEENQRFEEKIEELEKQKLLNAAADRLNSALSLIPSGDYADKVLKYERSIQKSIFQNIFLLKKLQGSF